MSDEPYSDTYVQLEGCQIEVDALREQNRALREALKDVFAMMEEGLLVRDTAGDGESDWGIKMMQFIRRLAAANSALTNAAPGSKQ